MYSILKNSAFSIQHCALKIQHYRFSIVHSALCIIMCAACSAPAEIRQYQQQAKTGWQSLPTVLQAIRPPVFPDKTFDITAYGADKTGKAGCKAAIQQAIEACHAAGGGRVLLPPGQYRCDGPVHLRSNVNLHVTTGAYLRFDTVPQQYLPLVKVRWEGTVCWNYSPLIYAFQQKNIALTGGGTVDGQSLSYWKRWRARQDPAKKRLRQMGNDTAPEADRRFGEGWWMRPSLVEFFECQNVLIEDITLRESPFWTTHPVFCKNVTIRKVKVIGGFLNDDGIDPDSCEDVLIEDCNIHTEDDAISIKAGRDQDAWQRPGTRNIVVRRCTLRTNVANAFCIGSELSGGVQQVFMEDCYIPGARYGFNVKTNLDRGGFVKNVFARNVKVDTCTETLVFFQTNYHSYRGGNFPTKFSDFYLQNIDCAFTDSTTIRLNGLPTAPIERIFMQKVTVKNPGGKPVIENSTVVIE